MLKSAKTSIVFEEFAASVKSTLKLFEAVGEPLISDAFSETLRFETFVVAPAAPPISTVKPVILTASAEFVCRVYEPILTLFVLGTIVWSAYPAFLAKVTPAALTVISGPFNDEEGTVLNCDE